MLLELTDQQKQKPYAKFYYEPMAPVAPESLDMVARGPIDPALAVPIQEADRLLLPGYMEVETGYCLMPDGSGYAAALIDMPGITAEMIEWYLAWFAMEELRYKIWDPECHHTVKIDKKFLAQRCDYSLSAPERRYGTSIVAQEDVGGGTSIPMTVSFLSPETFGLNMDLFTYPNATVNNICGHQGENPFAMSTQLYRHTGRGLELRARFWLGWTFADGQKVLAFNQVPLQMCKGIALHCLREYTNLASILPRLYAENHADLDRVEDFL